MTRLVFSAAAVLVGATTLRGADWPQWRGPDRTGISKETGLLKTWPKDGPPKVWTVAGCGGGFSSIVVADGVIYGTGSARGKNVAWARKGIFSFSYAPLSNLSGDAFADILQLFLDRAFSWKTALETGQLPTRGTNIQKTGRGNRFARCGLMVKVFLPCSTPKAIKSLWYILVKD
jgi:hypothetical protein